MKDLRILEEQQKESQRNLQAARETKTKKEAQLVKLEHFLGDLKYKDGKIRIELNRARESLALGQRQLSSVKNNADNAADFLRYFNE